MPKILLFLLLVCARADESFDAITNWASATYRVEIKSTGIDYPLNRGGYRIEGDNPDAAQVAAYLPLLRRELAKYPPALLARTRTKNIILAKKLALDGQLRAAVPDFASMNLFLDVERGSHSPDYQMRVFHHEYFHLIDLTIQGRGLADKSWEELNAPDFRYGPGGKFMQDSARNPYAPRRDIPGCLTLYSTSAVEEDKAELFSLLMTNTVFVNERSAVDKVVDAKQRRLRETLKKFCPELDERYFRQLEACHVLSVALPAATNLCRASLPCVLTMPVPDFVYSAK